MSSWSVFFRCLSHDFLWYPRVLLIKIPICCRWSTYDKPLAIPNNNWHQWFPNFVHVMSTLSTLGFINTGWVLRGWFKLHEFPTDGNPPSIVSLVHDTLGDSCASRSLKKHSRPWSNAPPPICPARSSRLTSCPQAAGTKFVDPLSWFPILSF